MSLRSLVAGLLVCAVLIVACDGESDAGPTGTAEPTPTATQSPTPSPTDGPDGTSTPEPGDPSRPPSSVTGVDGVDEVIAAVLSFSGDYSGLEPLIGYTEIGCTLELGAGGPPKCWNVPETDQVEGTLVEVFAFSVCEFEWAPRAGDLSVPLGLLLDPASGSDGELFVYGVYEVSPVAEPSSWPAGEYAVVFARLDGEAITGAVLRVAGGQVVAVEYGCGPTPPAALSTGLASGLLEPAVGGLALEGDAVVAAVERLPGFAAEETAPRWLAVLDLETGVNGYRSVLIDAETEIADADGASLAPEAIGPGATVHVEGAPLPWSFWRAGSVVVSD